jgi:hypothetical protein
VQLEGLGQLKSTMTSSGMEPEILLACSVVPQPITLQRAPFLMVLWRNLQIWIPLRTFYRQVATVCDMCDIFLSEKACANSLEVSPCHELQGIFFSVPCTLG